MNTSYEQRTNTESGFSKKRIIIIDDDVNLTMAVKINLEVTNNFIVKVCNDSSNAIKEAEEFHPDIILLDLVMPGLDGGDVSALLETNPHLNDVPVIMVTALVSNNETGSDDGVHSGNHLMIAKPVQFEKLLHAINSSLRTQLIKVAHC